ncbi:MAG: Nif3-like dinuclear metal center hexameric protein [bacterium]|nr:Nif3-like dinuclear metal center hexameric protein [bacterium]
MRIKHLIEFLESWAPPGAALSVDNPGLQIGDPCAPLTNILISLEITDRVIEEAIENQVNLILTHHPFLYKPLKSIDLNSDIGRKIVKLIKNNIAVYSAHTNLDAAPDGVSITLAKLLGVENPTFLTPPESKWQRKIVVFVPASHLEAVRTAMASACAGIIGDYTHCSFGSPGIGTFWGNENTSPVVGSKGVLEQVEEIKLEMLFPAWKLPGVLAAMKAAHPYEEVAYDVYSLDNFDVNFGFGAIGNLPEPIPLPDLYAQIRERLGIKALGIVEGPAETVTRLAVCSGSGGSLATEALKQGAEVFITGEMKYSNLLEYEDRLTIIVAGHYATERVILPVWTEKIQNWLKKEPVSVIETKVLTNPLKYLI